MNSSVNSGLICVDLRRCHLNFSLLLEDICVRSLGYSENQVTLASCGSVWLHRPKNRIDERDRVNGWELLSTGLPTYDDFLSVVGHVPEHRVKTTTSSRYFDLVGRPFVFYEPSETRSVNGLNMMKTLAMLDSRRNLSSYLEKFLSSLSSDNVTKLSPSIVDIARNIEKS